MTRTQKLGVFGALFFSVLLLTILFASGVLRFGLYGPSVYILYLLAGMLAALLTFGILTSSGQLQARRGSPTLTLGGAVVALVVVAGGGGVYERYLHRPETFDQLITFYLEDPDTLAPLKGTVTVYAANNDQTQPLDGTGRNRFLGLPSWLLSQTFDLSLSAPGYAPVKGQPLMFTRDRRLPIRVRRVQNFAVPTEDQLSIELAKAQVVDFGPRPDQRIVTVELKFRSTATLPTPLSNVARLEVFTDGGAPLWEAPLKSDRPFVIAEPGLSAETFEAAVGRERLDMLAGGRLAKITLKYEPSLGSQPREYSTAMFPVSPESLDDLSKPPK